ncbi:MAG: hypothetical protein OXN21_15545 [Chloroflexota bacterium]|nr:hypothetical protein [Chloroflexota bacterium]
MTDIGQILSGLLLRTAEGKLKWSPSARENRFVTSLDAISVVIEETQEYGRNTYRLDIFGESGDIVDSLSFRDISDEQDEELARLFMLARRSANNIDSTLEKLAKALDL